MKKEEIILLILARSGSTRLKNKNLKSIDNKPLIYFKIKSCLAAKIGKTVITSNSRKILKYAKKFGCNYFHLRPKIYSTSKASTISVVLNYLRFLKRNNFNLPKYIGVFPPTNPFLKSKSIIEAYKKLISNSKFDSIISYTDSTNHLFNFINFKKKKIIFNKYAINKKNFSSFERSQDRPKTYISSPALRITKVGYLLKYLKNSNPILNKKPFNLTNTIGQYINEMEALDINNLFDLKLARFYFKNKKFLM